MLILKSLHTAYLPSSGIDKIELVYASGISSAKLISKGGNIGGTNIYSIVIGIFSSLTDFMNNLPDASV